MDAGMAGESRGVSGVGGRAEAGGSTAHARDTGMTIDERIEALTMNLELVSRDIQDLKIASQQDGENIRALVRIAEIHERRLTHLEGEDYLTFTFDWACSTL